MGPQRTNHLSQPARGRTSVCPLHAGRGCVRKKNLARAARLLLDSRPLINFFSSAGKLPKELHLREVAQVLEKPEAISREMRATFLNLLELWSGKTLLEKEGCKSFPGLRPLV